VDLPGFPANALLFAMCGRYTQGKNQEQVTERIPFDLLECDLPPRYNIAPTQLAPVLVNREKRVLKEMRWGLIPFWAKDEAIGNQMINARAESLREKPAFRNPFKRRRCLVLADGFYEWQKVPGNPRKQPMRIRLRSEEPIVFGGLWEVWQKPDGGEVESYTIITCEPNDLMRPIHNRMPVIVKPEHYERWLDPQNENVEELARLLVPYRSDEMQAYPVSTKVNNPQFDDPSCIQPIKL
jgi:putative SOS response-associated peptidase YedK